jgi:hypothetical protein
VRLEAERWSDHRARSVSRPDRTPRSLNLLRLFGFYGAAVFTVTGSELEMPRAGAAWTGLGGLDGAHAPAEPTGDCANEEADKARQCGA